MAIDRDLPRPSFANLFLTELGLSRAEYDQLLARFTVKHLPKRSFHVQAGEVALGKAYVNKGCARSYVLDSKGKEHVLFFGFEDWWLADYESYTTGKPGKQFIQAIEDVELLYITRVDFEELSQSISALRNWYEVRQKKMVFSMIERLIEVKTLSPEERIQKLTKTRPEIFQRVALQDIASFLDIEPPSLSRLRKRMLEAERTS